MWRRKRKRANEGTLDVGAGLIGAGARAAKREAAVSDATRDGKERVLDAALSKKVRHFRRGHLFEEIEALKFNQDAERKGIALRAETTAAKGRHTDAADIEISKKNGEVVKSNQLKSHEDGVKARRALKNPKYDDMDKQVLRGNSGGDPRIKEELEAGGASSGGTTNEELERAVKNPKLYAAAQGIKQIARESAVAGGSAAGAGVVMGGAISVVKNLHAYSKGEKDGKEVLEDVAKDSAKSGIRSGSTGALGSVIRNVGKKIGPNNALAKSNVATAVASGVVDAGVTVYEFAKGDITAEEAAVRLGDTGCSTLSGIYIGAAGGAVFGPVGAIVGSVVGYMLSASVYQSCVAIFREAKLAEEEAGRVEALCEEAANAMDRQRREFEGQLATYLKVRQSSFDKHFRRIDSALLSNDHVGAIGGLSGLTRTFGRELQLGKFEDFRESMMESKEPLVL